MFRSFQPFLNPIGFGASDFIEFALAALIVSFFLLHRVIRPFVSRLAHRTAWCMLVLAVLPVVLRLALLPHHPVPAPDLYDEFTHLLVADTLRHFRFANPPHQLHQFFETFFVLQQPSYAAIYPIGQGMALAIGRVIFGSYWAGVILSISAFCALCYWMLRGWVTPVWALVGGLLTVFEFGPLSQWMNTYWGGAVSAAAGCLVFGALPRLCARPRPRDAVLLGLGLGIELLTRPYESIFLALSAGLFLYPFARTFVRLAPLAALIPLAAIGVTLAHNNQVTGSWLVLPEMASQYQYGVPTTFTFQVNPTPHRELTPQQDMGYRQQISFHGSGTDTPGAWLLRLAYRVRFYRFFLLAPLYLILPLFLLRLREYRFAWVLITLAVFALAANFYPFFFPHYIAAVSCLLILAAVVSLERLSRVNMEAALLLVLLCAGHFAFWYSLHAFEDPESPWPVIRYETWDQINHRNPQRRIMVNDRLAQAAGRQLVFVRYSPHHIFQDEWVYNDADIDAARIVWARDLGPVENEKLRKYYPGRTAWLLEPDSNPPNLNQYHVEPPPPVTPPPPVPSKPSGKFVLRFEEVR